MILNYIRILHEPSTIYLERESMYSEPLITLLRSAFSRARKKRHEYVTVEHMLLILLYRSSVKEMLRACDADVYALRASLTIFIEKHVPTVPDGADKLDKLRCDDQKLIFNHTVYGVLYDIAVPTRSLQCVIQHAFFRALLTPKMEQVKEVELLLSIFTDKASHAVYFLHEQGVTRQQVDAYLRRE